MRTRNDRQVPEIRVSEWRDWSHGQCVSTYVALELLACKRKVPGSNLAAPKTKISSAIVRSRCAARNATAA